MKRGRPRVHNHELLAKSLDEWSRKPDSIELLDWVNENDLYPQIVSRLSKEDENFCEALKKTKSKIAARRTKLANEDIINYGIYQRYQGMYDHFLKEDERDEKEYEANLRRKVDEHNQKQQVEATVCAIREIIQDKSCEVEKT